MPADIFGGSLNADIDAEVQRTMIERGGPGVVVDDERPVRMRNGDDGGNIRHLEGLRARRFQQHGAGIGLEQLFNSRTDCGIEIAGLDAITGQHAIAEIARGPVHIVADQEVVACLQHRNQGGRNRREPGGHQADAGALRSLQGHQRLLQRPGGRRTEPAILELAAMRVEVRGGRIKHGRTVNDGGIDEAFLGFCIAARRHQPGFRFLRIRRS